MNVPEKVTNKQIELAHKIAIYVGGIAAHGDLEIEDALMALRLAYESLIATRDKLAPTTAQN